VIVHVTLTITTIINHSKLEIEKNLYYRRRRRSTRSDASNGRNFKIIWSGYRIDVSTCWGASDGKVRYVSSVYSYHALIYLRFGKKTYANVRPTKWITGYTSPLKAPEQLDFVIVRECLEGSYLRVEGDLETLAPLNLYSPFRPNKPLHEWGKGKFGIKANTVENSEQVAWYAFRLAEKRKAAGYAGKVTIASKYNMYLQSDGLFQEVAKKVGANFPTIEVEEKIIDSCSHDLVRNPQQFDVLLMPNLYGDILSDAAAGLSGGLGVAPSGSYGKDYAYFEPVHGTAPDIAGKNCINPTATMLSAIMMLKYLGFKNAAKKWEQVITTVYQKGENLTKDMGGNSSTSEFTKAVLKHL